MNPPTVQTLVLASRSPRRQALLRAAGLDFCLRPAHIDESRHLSAPPRSAAMRTALEKAITVADQPETPDRLILAADTMVLFRDSVFNKPAHREEAARMLRTLSGNTHSVITALALLIPNGPALVDAVTTAVTFNHLPRTLIDDYIASGEADDKAGAYGIQGLGACFVASVQGDLSTVIGLPLARLRQLSLLLVGWDPFQGGHHPRDVLLRAFPDLRQLPPACLDGIPD